MWEYFPTGAIEDWTPDLLKNEAMFISNTTRAEKLKHLGYVSTYYISSEDTRLTILSTKTIFFIKKIKKIKTILDVVESLKKLEQKTAVGL